MLVVVWERVVKGPYVAVGHVISRKLALTTKQTVPQSHVMGVSASVACSPVQPFSTRLSPQLQLTTTHLQSNPENDKFPDRGPHSAAAVRGHERTVLPNVPLYFHPTARSNQQNAATARTMSPLFSDCCQFILNTNSCVPFCC